jgi:hypothetical protein
MTASLHPLDQCVQLEDALEKVDAWIRHFSCSPNGHGLLNYCMGLREGLHRGYKLGFAAGYNRAKGRKPKHPGKRGPTRKINPGLVFFFAFQLREHRREGVPQLAEAEEFLACMRAGAAARKHEREPLPSPEQLLAAYWRLRRELSDSGGFLRS